MSVKVKAKGGAELPAWQCTTDGEPPEWLRQYFFDYGEYAQIDQGNRSADIEFGDWLILSPDGQVIPVGREAFDALFEVVDPAAPVDDGGPFQ